jgi:hypothetical protein
MTNLKPCWNAPPSVGRVTPCPMSRLDGPDAANDIRELRNLLDAFNEAKKTAGLTLVKMLVTGLVWPCSPAPSSKSNCSEARNEPDLHHTRPRPLRSRAKLIDRLIPDPAQREQAKLALFQAEGSKPCRKCR